jgi:hypothetical protein
LVYWYGWYTGDDDDYDDNDDQYLHIWHWHQGGVVIPILLSHIDGLSLPIPLSILLVDSDTTHVVVAIDAMITLVHCCVDTYHTTRDYVCDTCSSDRQCPSF